MTKKVLFICLHRPHRSPSQRYRFEQYIGFLSKNGFDCRHVFLLNQKEDKTFYAKGKVFKKALILLKSLCVLTKHTFLRKYDITFVQREAFMLGTSFFERKMAKRSKLIYDLDDAIWVKQTGTIKSENKLFHFLKNPGKTNEIIQSAAMVFAGNQYIANHAKKYNPNVKVIPTTIDTDEYQLVEKNEAKRVCIGWSGSFSTIIHFEYVLDALGQLKDKYGDAIYFSVIGDGGFENKKLEIKGKAWSKELELSYFSEIDIGIMPLPNDEWTKGKCGFKALLYMSFGIPAVVSPVGVNTEIVEDGINGYFARSTQEWVDKISLLVDDAMLRKRMGELGRKVVVDQYSTKSQEQNYLRYFNELID